MGVYADRVRHEQRNMTPAQVRAGKCQTTKARNEARKALVRKQAEERQAERDKLSPQEQLARLDRRLGKGVGATKERKRLKQLIEN